MRAVQTAADVSRAPEDSEEESEEEGEEEAEAEEGEEEGEGAPPVKSEAKPSKVAKSEPKPAPKAPTPPLVSAVSRTGALEEKRLWPSIEARQYWKGYVHSAASFAQLGVACTSLRDHAASFGLLGKKADGAGARRRCEQVWDVL